MKKAFIIVCIFLAIALLQWILRPVFEQLELLTYDMRAKIAVDDGPFSNSFSHADKNIVIVAVNDYSANEIASNPQLDIGAWPWKREVWAKVVRFIEKGHPKAILFDLIFNDVNPDSFSDGRFSYTLRQYDNVVLANSLSAYKPYVDREGFDVKTIVNPDFVPTADPLDVQISDKNLDNNITYYAHSPLHSIYSKYNTVAIVNKVMYKDSVIRSSQPLFKLVKNGETYYMPSLSFAGFLKYMGEDAQVVVKNRKIYYKGRVIPVDGQGITPISWHGTGSGKDYPYVNISSILMSIKGEDEIDPDYFKDKIVIIGRTQAGTDIHPSSVDASYPGPEANATAIDNLIHDSDPTNKMARKFVVKSASWFNYLLTGFFCVCLVYVILYSRTALYAFFNSSMLLISYILICIYAYVNPSLRAWIPMAIPVYYMLATWAIVFSERLHKEATKKAEVMNMFGKFVSPKVLSNLMKNSENLELKNSRKHITVLFCDVKDFTSLSEKCNPEQLVENLNELFNEIVNTIFENDGTVDKFVGDCVMAYWGDPISSENDAYMAVKTALEIKRKVDDLKIENLKNGKIVFDVKIGINSGDALLGLAGSDKIMSYTCMGDAVNTAARLEAACSRLGRDILISKATLDETQGKVVVLDVATIDVKGKDEKIQVFEPIGLADTNSFLDEPVGAEN